MKNPEFAISCFTFLQSMKSVFRSSLPRIVMAMASSSAMVTTYSGATQKSVRITESEDRGFLALSLHPLANILVAKLLNPVLTPGDWVAILIFTNKSGWPP